MLNDYQLILCSMTRNSLILFITLISFTGCKNNNIEIIGKLTNPIKGEYIYLDELRSGTLVTVDSVPMPEDGSFVFSVGIESPAFYLLKTDENNFLTMLLEPGERVEIKSDFDSLNFPASITGSKGTELMVGYSIKLRETVNKLSGLREIYLKGNFSFSLRNLAQSMR